MDIILITSFLLLIVGTLKIFTTPLHFSKMPSLIPIKCEHVQVYFPIVACIIISIILSLLLTFLINL